MKLRFLMNSGMQKRIAALLSTAMIVTGMGTGVLAASVDDAVFEEAVETEEETGAVGEEFDVSDEESAETEAGDILEEDVTVSGDDSLSGNETGGGEGNGNGNEDGGGNGNTISGNSSDVTVSGDGVPTEYDKSTFVFNGEKASVDPSVFSASFSVGNVKLKYKIPGAKSYAIARVAYTDSGADVTVIKHPGEGFKKKAYTDKAVTNGIGVYVIQAYADLGGASPIGGKYAAIPASYIMSASSDAKGDVNVTFASVGHGSRYQLEICEGNNKFSPATETLELTESDLVAGSVGGRHCFTYVDKGRASKLNMVGTGYSKKKVYYRVTVTAPAAGFADGPIVSKASNKMGCFGERYAALEIVDMVGTEQHPDGCYSGAIIWFRTPSQNTVKLDNSDITSTTTTYDVLRTINGKNFTSIATVKGSALLRPTDKSSNLYGINVTGLLPGMKYSYAIVATRKSKKTEMSNVWSYYFDFVEVYDLVSEAVNNTTTRLTWTTEQCATKYTVYRTLDGDSTVSAANAKMEAFREWLESEDQRENVKNGDLKLFGIKKAKSITNTLPTWAETTVDIGKLKAGLIYSFMVVPCNENAYGFRSAGTVVGVGGVSSPRHLTYTTKGITSFKLSWPKMNKATGYLIERITLSDQSVEDDLDATEDWKYLSDEVSDNWISGYYSQVVDSSTKEIVVTGGSASDIYTAVPGVCYLYRVRSIYSNKGADTLADPIKDVMKVGVIGPKHVKELKSSMVTRHKGNNYYWDNNSNKLMTLSGNKVGARGVKITFNAQDKNYTDHYEIQKSEDDGYTYTKLPDLLPGDKNEANYFKTANTSITFYDDNLKRGVPYAYRVRPVASDGTPGAWVKVDFSVASAWYMYAKQNSNYNNINCVNKRTGFTVNAGSTQRLYLTFNPLEVTEDDYSYSTPSWLSVEGTGTEKIADVEIHYIDIKVAEGTSGKDGKITLKYDRPYDEVDAGETKKLKNISMHIVVPD